MISFGIGLGFLIQTVVGFAATLFALPILLTVLSLQESIALLSIFHLIFSITLIGKNYKLIDKKIALEMATGGVIGLIVGVHVLKYGNPEILKKLLGIFIALYVVYTSLKKQRSPFLQKIGLFLTLLGGFFSGLFSAGGPLFAVYIYNKLSKPTIIRATLIGALMIVNIFRIPLLIANNLIDSNTLFQSAIVLPFFFTSIYFGEKLHKNIDESTFKNVFLSLLLITAISLILK